MDIVGRFVEVAHLGVLIPQVNAVQILVPDDLARVAFDGLAGQANDVFLAQWIDCQPSQRDGRAVPGIAGLTFMIAAHAGGRFEICSQQRLLMLSMA